MPPLKFINSVPAFVSLSILLVSMGGVPLSIFGTLAWNTVAVGHRISVASSVPNPTVRPSALWAHLLLCVDSCSSNATKDIYLLCDWLKMGGVAAASISAYMVKFHPVRDCQPIQRPHDLMGRPRAGFTVCSNAEIPVALDNSAMPNPARSRLFNLSKEKPDVRKYEIKHIVFIPSNLGHVK